MSNTFEKITTNKLCVNRVTCLDGKVTVKDDLEVRDDLRVGGSLKLDLDKVMNVPSPEFPTIQSAVDHLAGRHAGRARINIAPGKYEEYVDLSNFSSGINNQQIDPDQDNFNFGNQNRGLQIVGDPRRFLPCKAYVNGYENAQDSGRGLRYQITTTSPVSGPYDALLAAGFGEIGGFTGGAQVANEILAGVPLTNVFAPNELALISRGVFGFATKALNAQNGGGVGASAAIIYNNQPGIIAMGGTSNSVSIPAYSVSDVDGLALQSLIMANPGIQFNITPVDPLYDPPLGTNYAITQLTLNGARDTVTVTMTGPLPDADDNILGTPQLVQPDFNNEKVALVPGDKIAFADADVLGNYVTSLHTVTSVLGNQVTFTPVLVAPGGSWTADFAGTTMTVTGAVTGALDIGQTISGGSIPFGTTIVSLDSGVLGAIGSTYTISNAHSELGVSVTATGGVDVTVPGASLTFLPNVCISPPFMAGRTPTPAFNANGIDFSMDGLWVDQNADQPFANILEGFRFANCNVVAANIAVTDFFDTTANNLAIHPIGGTVYNVSGVTDVSGKWAVIGWAEGIGVSSQSMLRFGSYSIFHIPSGGSFGGSLGTQIGIENLQIFGQASLFQPGAVAVRCGGDGNYADVTINVNKIFHVGDIIGNGIGVFQGSTLILNHPGARIDRCYNVADGIDTQGAIFIDSNAKMAILGGLNNDNGNNRSRFRQVSEINDNNDSAAPGFLRLNAGIVVRENGEFFSVQDVTFSNNDLDTQVFQGGKLSILNGAAHLNNVLQVTAAGAVDSSFELQALVGGAVLAMTLDPAATFGIATSKLYHGKTFTLFSDTATAHSLALPGAFFFGAGAGMTATFAGSAAGESITFRVLSDTSVLVTALNGVSIA